MVLLAGKFFCGAKLELQSRIFLIPWVKKFGVRNSLKYGDEASVFPVRYILKNSSKTNKLKSPSSPSVKESFEGKEVRRFTVKNSSKPKELQPRSSSAPVKSFEVEEIQESTRPTVSNVDFPNFRRGIVSDENSCNEYRSSSHSLVFNYESEEEDEIDQKGGLDEYKVLENLVECEVMEGPEETSEEITFHSMGGAHKQLTLEAVKTKQNVENVAIGILATRAFTAVELKKKLLGKKYSQEVVNALIEDFRSRGFINDLLYAEAFSRSRWSSSSWGPRRIKQALVEKGVSKVDAEKAIKLVFEDGESGENDNITRLGLSKQSMDHLFAQASKQWFRGQDLPDEKRKSRIINWLQYRGFNWGIINIMLKKLQSECPP